MNRHGIMGLLLWVFFPLVASAQIPDSIAGQPDTLSVAVRSDKAAYQPYDSIRLDVEVRDAEGRPCRRLSRFPCATAGRRWRTATAC